MDIFVYREGSDKVEEGFSLDQLPALLQNDKLVIWVDMEAPSEADDRVLLDIFHFFNLLQLIVKPLLTLVDAFDLFRFP